MVQTTTRTAAAVPTAGAGRCYPSAGDLEELFRRAATVGDGLRLEFIGGRLGIKERVYGDRGQVLEWLTRACAEADERWRLFPDRGLRVGAHRRGFARPDGTLAASGAFAGQGEWTGAEGVLMVVEVTSGNLDTDWRATVEKPRAYAEAGIPVYLLVDRDNREIVVHSEPDGVRYQLVATPGPGRRVRVPGPVGIELDTEALTGLLR